MFSNNTPKPQAASLQVFQFNQQEGTPIRVQVIEREPWFVAKDVCRVLGIANHKDAVSRLDADEKQGVGITDPLGGRQQATAVSESGLYHLIFQSRKSEAKAFRRWVTGEVLPTLRRTGRYALRQSRVATDITDLRDVPYQCVALGGSSVRMVEMEGERWYSINDLFRAIGSRTDSTQSVRRLNAKRILARKLHLFGMTHAGWFTTGLGVQLLLSASRKVQENRQLMLDFNGEEA